MEIRGPPYTVGENVNWCNHYEKQYRNFFKKSTKRYHMIHQHHSWTHTQKNDNSNLKRYMCLNVHSNGIYNSEDMETTQLAINR